MALNPILAFSGQAGLVCKGAHFLCVIRGERTGLCVCKLGAAVQQGLWLFCLLKRKGMPKSNTVNRTQSETQKRAKDGGKKWINCEERDE